VDIQDPLYSPIALTEKGIVLGYPVAPNSETTYLTLTDGTLFYTTVESAYSLFRVAASRLSSSYGSIDFFDFPYEV
jgi:hypothetical protein